jgi:hypothetical protein
MIPFPTLDGFGPSRETLHKYAQAINVLARVHAEPRPNWWHTSLKVTSDGLASDPLPLPDGGTAVFLLDLRQHRLSLMTHTGAASRFPTTEGWSGTQMGDALIAAAAELGLDGDYERERFMSDAPGVYDPDAVGRFFTALTSANRLFKDHMSSLSGEKSPVQLWPHGFDLSAEWYGTRQIAQEEDGETSYAPAQLNLGFYPGAGDSASYFYSNPWPFEAEKLMGQALVDGALWHTEGWQGAQFPYEHLVGQPDAAERVTDFARVVFGVATPTLIE